MAYKPSQHTTVSTPIGISNNSTDARSRYYDETLFKYRDYVSINEVLTYLPTSANRIGGFPIFINSTGTLLNGVITGGLRTVWWFKDGQSDGDLVEMLPDISGLFIPVTQKGVVNGVATLGSDGYIPSNQLNISPLNWKGAYNPNTNVPPLVDGTGTSGDVYRVSVNGTHDFGSGSISLLEGQYVIYNGAMWEIFNNAGTIAFLDLIDVPNTYVGAGGKPLVVNDSEDGIEFGEFGGGVEQYSSLVSFPLLGKSDILYVNTTTNDGYYWNGSTYKLLGAFTSNTTVSLSGGKFWLGKYPNGTVVNTMDKSLRQVFSESAVEPIVPTINLTSSTVIAFNQSAINNVLQGTYTIQSAGATVTSVLLEWRRNNTGSWTSLSTDTTNPLNYTHTLTDPLAFSGATNPSGTNTQPFNYRYTVVDSQGATSVATLNITPQVYVAPSITFSAPATALGTLDSNTIRARGNVSSILQGSTSRLSVNVPISSYQYSVSINGGGYTNIGSSGSLSSTGGSFLTSTDTTPNSSTSTVSYRVSVTDNFTTTMSTYTITFKYIIFAGASLIAPTNSTTVRALTKAKFVDGTNPFILNTGTSFTKFTVAMPTSRTIAQVLDLDNLNLNITSEYVLNNFDVNDEIGTPVAYNVYIMSIANPYNPSTRHQITNS